MNLPQSPSDSGPPLVLPANCNTAAAAALADPLRAHVGGRARPVIDASLVETMGQACVQLFIAAQADNPDLRFFPVSAAFAEQMDRLGLAAMLGLDPVGV